MHRASSRRAAAALTLALLVTGATACGSSDKGAAEKGTDPTTTVASGSDGSSGATGGGSSTEGGTSGDGTSGDGSSSGGSGDGGSSGGAAAGTCVADSERLSGSSTVIWTADSKSEHTGDEATADTTLLLQADGSMEPSELTVKVGQVFTFGLADGVEEIAAITVGCDSGQTVYSGPALASEYITTPGTYAVLNDIAGEEVGTITVE